MSELGVIIQARSGSTRLPGKMLRTFYGHQTIVEILVRRIRTTFPELPVLLATTTGAEDDDLERIGTESGAVVFRGDRDNVLKRFIDGAAISGFTDVIRVCADNPFFSMDFLRSLVEFYKGGQYDYVSFKTRKGVPAMKTHFGLFCEIVKTTALHAVAGKTGDPFYLEHVTNYIYENGREFALGFLDIPEDLEQLDLRLTVDTEADFTMAMELYAAIKERGEVMEYPAVINFLKRHPVYFETMRKEIKKNSK